MFPKAHFIPEGGLSIVGILGAVQIADHFDQTLYDHIILAGGTMCTACGLIINPDTKAKMHIVPAWKGCTRAYVEQVMDKHKLPHGSNWDVWPDYHFGGFGKFNDALIQLMTDFTKQTSIPLDPVYNGKVVYALMDQLKKGEIGEGEKVLVIHTGGLQGIKGYAYRFPGEWSDYAALVDELGKG